MGAINERASVNKQHILDIFREFKAYSRLKETRRKKLHFSEVIHDAGLLHFNNDQEFQMPFPSRKRSLFPKHIQRSQAQNCSLLLTVVGGKNVPVKLETDNFLINDMSRQRGITHENDTEDNPLLTSNLFASANGEAVGETIGTIIKVKFRGKTLQMQFKETIHIPLHDMLQDNSSVSPVLLQKEEYIEITLFDCTNIDLRH